MERYLKIMTWSKMSGKINLLKRSLSIVFFRDFSYNVWFINTKGKVSDLSKTLRVRSSKYRVLKCNIFLTSCIKNSQISKVLKFLKENYSLLKYYKTKVKSICKKMPTFSSNLDEAKFGKVSFKKMLCSNKLQRLNFLSIIL